MLCTEAVSCKVSHPLPQPRHLHHKKSLQTNQAILYATSREYLGEIALL